MKTAKATAIIIGLAIVLTVWLFMLTALTLALNNLSLIERSTL